MKNMFKKSLAAIMTVASLAVGMTGVSASAAFTNDYLLTTSEKTNIVYDADSARSTHGSFYYDATSSKPAQIGKVRASSSSMTIYFSEPSVGAATIRIRSGSYTGPIVKSVTPPVAGTTSTSFRDSFSVTKGSDYYLEVVTAGGYAQTVGMFSLDY